MRAIHRRGNSPQIIHRRAIHRRGKSPQRQFTARTIHSKQFTAKKLKVGRFTAEAIHRKQFTAGQFTAIFFFKVGQFTAEQVHPKQFTAGQFTAEAIHRRASSPQSNSPQERFTAYNSPQKKNWAIHGITVLNLLYGESHYFLFFAVNCSCGELPCGESPLR
jgi:hypothetical protein